VSPIKTLIEILDGCPVENVIAGLRFKPQKIVFVGFKNHMKEENKRAIHSLFSKRNINTKFEYEIVPRYDYDEITCRLFDIIERNEDCWFDLSGGKDITLAAMGAVSQEKNIPMFQIDVTTGDVIKLKACENIPQTEKSYLTISEAVELNGCGIIHNPPEDFSWDMTVDFKSDIEKMWSICRKDCEKWNWQSVVLKNCEQNFGVGERFSLKIDKVELKKQGRGNFIDAKFMMNLNNAGLILDYFNNGKIISFRYKNKQVHECITKAGNILELYAYMLICEIASEEPGWYDDADIGVYIDWDGIIHSNAHGIYDIKNEVDIVVMRDLVPIFISCKNGEVPKEAFYELQTVADKFGGRFAKKFMLASYVNRNSLSKKYTLARAEEMGINLIHGVHNLNRDEFKAILKSKLK